MLLNEITTSDDLKIKKINDVLQKTYGFTLVSEVKTGTLNNLYTQIADDLYDLKLDLSTAKSPAYMQKVLVLEGLKILIKKNNTRLEEAGVLAGKGGRAFTRILTDLTAFVDKVCEMGDDYEEAIKDAMKHYRSSKYRFQDEVVEYELRKATVDDCTDTVVETVEQLTELDRDTYLSYMNKSALDMQNYAKQGMAAEIEGDDELADTHMGRVNKRAKGIERSTNSLLGPRFDDDEELAPYKGDLAIARTVARGHSDMLDDVLPVNEGDDFMGIKPQNVWWENDPEDLMRFIYWKRGQMAPDRPSAFAKNWNNIVKQLSQSNPPPADWVNPIKTPEPTEQECSNCRGRKHEPNDKIEPCHKCDATGVMVEDDIEEGGDRHAEHDWVQGMKKDAGIGPGYEDDTSGLSILNPEDDSNKQDDADDFFSYRSKQKRTEMKEGYVKELRKLLEAETDQAESLIAAKSFSQELQDMVEKLGRLVNENLPAVSEQMRDAYGSDVATGFEDLVSGTLNSVMDALRQSKQEIDNSVSTIADGGAPTAGSDMENFSDEQLGGEFDAEADLDLDGDVELALDDEMVGDEFGGDDAVAGLEDEPLGRAKKEALVIIGKKLVETKAKLARIKAKQ